MNKKQKSSIILGSLATIAVAGSLIAGSTYALFTSESTTNIAVTSGKVDVSAKINGFTTYSGKENSLVGNPDTDEENIITTTVNGTFTNGGKAVLENGDLKLTNMTPGDRVAFTINIENNSNVNVKYRTVVTKSEDDGLFSGLKITVGGQTFYGLSSMSKITELSPEEDGSSVDVVVDFPTDKINTYQEKKCTLSFSVNAYQGNTYLEDSDLNYLLIYNTDDLEVARYLIDNEVLADSEYNNYLLMNDLDLTSYTNFTPIANGGRDGKTFSGKKFTGTFNGNGHVIDNLTINDSNSETVTDDSALGLFGVVSGGTIKNIIFKNVAITTSKAENVGTAVGLLVNNGTVKNVKVNSGSIIGYKGFGGIVGRMTVQGNIIDCENNASISTVEGKTGSNVGGIVGAAYYTEVDKEMNITHCVNKGVITCAGTSIGGVVGLSSANVSDCKNTAAVTNTGSGTSLGGIVGWQKMYGTVSGCENTGAVTGENMGYGTGGIVGWVVYNDTVTNYARYGKIVVNGNKNSGNIKGNSTAGGIVGIVYHAGDIIDNTNTATSIISTGVFSAGIVGDFQSTENTQVGYNAGDVDVTFKGNSTCAFTKNSDGDTSDLLIYDNTHKIVIEN